MAQARKASDFFVAGGTMRPDASSYVQRPADDELFEEALAGEFCYVLTPRQMGKSSLMIRTDRRLKDEGVKTVIIDLTNIGTDVSVEQWYLGVLSRVKRRLRLETDLEAWWDEREAFGYLQRFTDFLREVVMTAVAEPVVIFIDEIDSTLSLDFRDDFFAGIRALHNARAEDPNLIRLTFVLLGVAAPTELITDRSRTPFNIGHEITLQEFNYQDAAVLQAGLESGFPGQGEAIFKRIYHWTNGHPYLTQKLCLAVTECEDGQWNDGQVDAVVTRLFLTEEARKETNLKFIQDRILADDRKTDLLKLYRKVLRGKDIEDDGQSLLQNQLKLSGLVKIDKGVLHIRNEIYRWAFNENWIKENLPKVTPQRIAIIASVLAVIAISIIVYLIIQAQGQEADVQAQTYIQQFENSQSSDVRLVSLSGLIDLGEPYNQDAERLFWEMNHEEQTALFENVSAPYDFEYEIAIIVTAVYQNLPNTQQGNKLLDTMAEILGEPRLKTEIEFWLQARSLVDERQYWAAISVYENAWRMSEEREHPNPSVLFERGVLASNLGDYDKALADFETVLSMDEIREGVVRELIANSPEMLGVLWRDNTQYPALSGILPTPTPTLTPSFTPMPPTLTDTQSSSPTSTLAPTPTPQIIIDNYGIPMALVPAGPFEMGSEVGREDEKPIHTVQLVDFYIDQYEVTNARYAECVDTGKCIPLCCNYSATRKEYYGNKEYADYPVIYINWDEAQIYCQWRDARVPTEAEWEKAARGGLEKALYPWGNDVPVCEPGAINGAKFNEIENCPETDTEPVGNYSANGYGLYDMAGNVWEQTADWYEVYPDGDPTVSDYFGKQYRGLRGGSWASDVSNLRVAFRGMADPDHIGSYSIGFRCVQDAAQMQILLP